MKRFSTQRMAVYAVVGAAYAALTLALLPLSFGPLQCRVSEALCVLPFLLPGTQWGLFVGCALANLLGGAGVLDVVFGSLATLLAGCATARARAAWLAPLPPVLANAAIVGAVLAWTSAPGAFWETWLLYAAEIGLGELAACCGLGLPLLALLPRAESVRRYLRKWEELP